MKTNVKSLAFACGLALAAFSWSAGPARAQGFSTFANPGVPTGTNTGGFARLAGFYGGYGYPPTAPSLAVANPPTVLIPKVLTSYVPSYEGVQTFYGARFTGGAYRPYTYFYRH
jgi:hypothetical protein